MFLETVVFVCLSYQCFQVTTWCEDTFVQLYWNNKFYAKETCLRFHLKWVHSDTLQKRGAQLHVWYLWSFFVVRMKGWSACVYIRVAANPPIQHGIKSWGTKPTYSLQVTCWRYTKWKTPHLCQQHFSMKSNVNTFKGIFWTDWQSSFGLSDKGCSVYMYVIHVFK